MLRLLIIYLVLCIASLVAINVFNVEFSNDNYWDHHGVFLLIFLALFPRLALLFSSIPFGGLFWWLGFIFCPHYLVAILATIHYWPKNAFLVTAAWFIALSGEVFEKYCIKRAAFREKRTL